MRGLPIGDCPGRTWKVMESGVVVIGVRWVSGIGEKEDAGGGVGEREKFIISASTEESKQTAFPTRLFVPRRSFLSKGGRHFEALHRHFPKFAPPMDLRGSRYTQDAPRCFRLAFNFA